MEMPRRHGVTLVAVFLLLAGHVPAHADATAFGGAISSATTRPAVGAAIGFFPRATAKMLGWEFEVARAPGAGTPDRHRIKTTGGSLIVQSLPLARRWQFYGLFGLNVYGETVDGGDELGTGLAAHVGGGAKFTLVGPLRVRLDYRVYIPSDNEDYGLHIERHPRRIAAGIALAF